MLSLKTSSGAVPGTNLRLEIIEKIVQLWFDNPSGILDLGCGNGILGRYLLDKFQIKSDPGISRKEVANSFSERPDKDENKLTPVEQQCGWLREIGFKDVDCFFKLFEIAIFGGRKTPGNPVHLKN